MNIYYYKKIMNNLTEAEVKYNSEIATQHGLIELGKEMYEKESNELAIDTLYELLNNLFTTKFNSFNIDEIDGKFNLDQFITTNKNSLTFWGENDDYLKLLILHKLHMQKIEYKDTKINELCEINEDLDDQINSYIEQMDEEETKQKITENRIVNLRNKCIEKNKQIYIQKIMTMFLSYICIISKESFFNYLIFLFSFLIETMSYIGSAVLNIGSYLLTPSIILIGTGIIFANTFNYYAFSRNKEKEKEV